MKHTQNYQLTPWSRVILRKLVVAQPVNKLLEPQVLLVSLLSFQVLVATSMKMAVFWNVAHVVDIGWNFRAAYCLHHQGNIPEEPYSIILFTGVIFSFCFPTSFVCISHTPMRATCSVSLVLLCLIILIMLTSTNYEPPNYLISFFFSHFISLKFK
jgi:hypothetical protein